VYQSQVNADRRNRSAGIRSTLLDLRSVPRSVLLLGVTSLLTDMSSEMVVAVLPVYALYFLHLSPAAFGVVDGLQQGGASLVKLASGWYTDRSRRYKTMAASGYIASIASRLGLLAVGSNAALLTPLVALDRIGKGIRTAPRDAIISLTARPDALGSAFGVHRALDTCGAMLGPLLGFAVLVWIRDGYDVVFVISLGLAAIGAAVLVAFVDSPAAPPDAGSIRTVKRTRWPRRFVRVATSAGILGLASISDSFIYLSLQRRLGFGTEYLPLLYVATPAVYLSLAAPIGAVADRVGSATVIMAGYAALFAVYFALSSNLPATVVAIVCVALLGAFYASTDGVFAALASAELPGELRATGLAMVGTCQDVGRMAASLLFGWMWSHPASISAVQQFQVMLVIAAFIACTLLWPMLIGEKQGPVHD